MATQKNANDTKEVRYPGIPSVTDGSGAVVYSETLASDAAGSFPITPSTQMGEGWAEAYAKGQLNAFGRPLLFVQPEGEHAAAGVTAGFSMIGLRSTNFSSGQGVVYMHESLYPATGKRLTYILNIASRALTKQSLNVHCGHDDYHSVADTGFFQIFSKNIQESADLCLIAHKIAELSLNPGIHALDGFLTSHAIEMVSLPEPALIKEFLGDPSDIIPTPTPAQEVLYGSTRRRIPELWTVDAPQQLGTVQNQDSYQQGVVAQRPFFFDHIHAIAQEVMREYGALTGRNYDLLDLYRMEDAEYVIVGMGSMLEDAQVVADYLREQGIKVGVLGVRFFRPFPGAELVEALAGKKGIVVLERTDNPLAEDLPLIQELRAAFSKSVENTTGSTKVYSDYPSITTIPPLFSGVYGLGSRDLQPSQLIAAVENMLPSGLGRRFFYLGMTFKQDAETAKNYPHLTELTLPMKEDPNLFPKDALTVRFHSVGGWGAITAGKNLSFILHDLFGLHMRSNPQYGSEKKGQPTKYFAAFSKERIKLGGALKFVDVVLSPDPNSFSNSNPLSGLKEQGVLILQTKLQTPQDVWASLPATAQKIIKDKKIRVFFIEAFAIAQQEAKDISLKFRMQGNAFLGAFFKASSILQDYKLSAEELFVSIEKQLESKFGKKGKRVVEDNLRVIKRGFAEVQEIDYTTLSDDSLVQTKESIGVDGAVTTVIPLLDKQRFWNDTASLYAQGVGENIPADPFLALSTTPAVTSVFRDMTGTRLEHPQFIPDKCTGCSQCWTQCPDMAIPGLVVEIGPLLHTVLSKVEKTQPIVGLRKIEDTWATACHALVQKAGKDDPKMASFADIAEKALTNVSESLSEADEKIITQEFSLVLPLLRDFPLAKTGTFFDVSEKQKAGSGALLAITINPSFCKGCMECVEVCPDNALIAIEQTPESVATLRKNWDLWEDLPSSNPEYIRISNLAEGIGPLPSLLLNKDTYFGMIGGDGACAGCGEKTPIHLFIATVHALMQPRVQEHITHLTKLTQSLKKEIIREDLVLQQETPESAVALYGTFGGGIFRPEKLLAKVADTKDVIEQSHKRKARLVSILHTLESVLSAYTDIPGRASLGMINNTGCTTVWGSTFPYNPYPFPWANHLFQDGPSVAMGIFEGHMRKMADGFTAIRKAELELSGRYDQTIHDTFFTYFTWESFSDDEWLLCPPVVTLGGDGAMIDIGFQNLSRLLASGKPVKVLVVDTQVYSNTGGQSSTATYSSQVADLTPYGKIHPGKTEVRKELGLLAIAHRSAFVAQTSAAQPNHLIKSYITGLNKKLPALFNIYTTCQPEHGVGDDQSRAHAKLALEGRAFPFFTYDPELGDIISSCLSLDGNPDVTKDWPSYTITNAEGKEEKMAMTFADFAATEDRFKRGFASIPAGKSDEDLVPLSEFIALPEKQRGRKLPYIVTLDENGAFKKLVPTPIMVATTKERLQFWNQLQDLAGINKPQPIVTPAIPQQPLVTVPTTPPVIPTGTLVRNGNVFAQDMASSSSVPASVSATEAPSITITQTTSTSGNASRKAFIDTDDCTSCGECINRNASMFAYNDKGLAFVKDPTAGPFSDMVQAAECCPVMIIHPGDPVHPTETDVDAWVKRAEPYQAVGASSSTPSTPIPLKQEESTMDASSTPTGAPTSTGRAPHIDTDDCTSCGECINRNGNIFAYNDKGLAFVKDPTAGPYSDIVQAAECCPVMIIHPGDPINPAENDLEKWKKRAESFN